LSNILISNKELNDLYNKNWVHYFENNTTHKLYQSNILQFEVSSSQNLNYLRYSITLSLKNKVLNGEEFKNLIDLSQIFINSLKRNEIELVVLEQNEWIFHSKLLKFTDKTRKILIKIFHLIYIIFEDLKSHLS